MSSEPDSSPHQLALDDPHRIVRVVASDGKTNEQREIAYTNCKVIGNGSFGVVFQARLVSEPRETEDIAIKKVLQDKRFKVGFLLFISPPLTPPDVLPFFPCHAAFSARRDRSSNHRIESRTANNEACVASQRRRSHGLFLFQRRKGWFISPTYSVPIPMRVHPQKDEVYLNLVLEYVPETVYRASRHYAKLKQPMPALQIKLYMYQLLRSLAYIHSLGICHRDIKPQNLLLNPATGVLKLCDFGSAKILVAGEPNVSYICSRYYRAPELIFGATNYTTNIGESMSYL